MLSKLPFSFILAALPALALANRLQVWTQEDVSVRTHERFVAGISEENRYGISDLDGSKHVDEIHVAPFLDRYVFGWLSIGANYRHVLLRNGSDARWSEDRRPGIDVALKEKLGNLSLLNRSRVICRIPEHEDPYFRYRNLSKVSYSLGTASPYVSYEWYYDEGSHDRPYRKNDRFSQQWISIGLDWRVAGPITVSPYYRLVENKDGNDHDWYPGHVLGIVLAARF